MGYTICYDTLIEQAKNSKIRSSAEPGQEDPEFIQKVEEEKEKYKKQAKQIFDAESAKLKANFKKKKLEIKASKPIKENQFMMDRFNSIDAEKYGEENIKTTMQRELTKLLEGDEKSKEDSDEKLEKQKNEADENQLQNFDKESINQENKTIDNFNSKIDLM